MRTTTSGTWTCGTRTGSPTRRWALVYELLTLPKQLPAARRTLAGPPHVSFVLDHCYAEVVEAARALTAELSAAERESTFAGTATRVCSLAV